VLVEDINFEELKLEVATFQAARRNTRQKYPAAVAEKIKKLLDQGHRVGALNRELNISYDVLQRWGARRVKKSGQFKELKVKSPNRTVEKSETIPIFVDNGLIQLKFEVSLEQVIFLRELLRAF